MAAARNAHSIALEASAITEGGVYDPVDGTRRDAGWREVWLDPAIALASRRMSLDRLELMQRSTAGLMDASLPSEDLERIEQVLDRFRAQGLEFHALRTRQAGARAFITLHVSCPVAGPSRRRTSAPSASKAICGASFPEATSPRISSRSRIRSRISTGTSTARLPDLRACGAPWSEGEEIRSRCRFLPASFD